MNKIQKEKKIIIILIIVAGLIVLAKMFTGTHKKIAHEKMEGSNYKSNNEFNAKYEVKPIKQKAVLYYGDKYSDPTISPVHKQDAEDPKSEPTMITIEEEKVHLPPVKINGIVWTNLPGSRQVLINGEILNEGQISKDNIEILHIREKKVIVFYKNKEFVLQVDEKNVEKR